ncbi:MAG: transposase [Acidimicrobiales bacterium]
MGSTRHVRACPAGAALDAFRGYNTALVAILPQATVVMDHFQAVALANRAWDKVRRRVQTAPWTTGAGPPGADPRPAEP